MGSNPIPGATTNATIFSEKGYGFMAIQMDTARRAMQIASIINTKVSVALWSASMSAMKLLS